MGNGSVAKGVRKTCPSKYDCVQIKNSDGLIKRASIWAYLRGDQPYTASRPFIHFFPPFHAHQGHLNLDQARVALNIVTEAVTYRVSLSSLCALPIPHLSSFYPFAFYQHPETCLPTETYRPTFFHLFLTDHRHFTLTLSFLLIALSRITFF